MPCCAHNIQLVIKDGFKLSEEYNKLIDKVSKNIVTKSKYCIAVAEETLLVGIQRCLWSGWC
jgi:hypothetical protein